MIDGRMVQDQLEELACRAREDRRHLLEHVDEGVLEILRRRFEVRQPVFRRGADGRYDHDAALMRDAYREVVLWLEDQLELARKEGKR